MYMYDSLQRAHAIKLRLSGMSYTEIQKALGIRSKSTLSVWFKNLELSPEARVLLADNIARATSRKLLEFNTKRTERIRNENIAAQKDGASEIGSISRRDLLIAGAALYWGEGTKSEGGSSYNSVAFSNSDPKMIRVFLRFLREILNVPASKIRGSIHLYENHDKDEVVAFWSRCTNIPHDRFTLSYQVSSASKKIRKPLPYGTLNIKVHNRHFFYRIKGLIDGLGREIS